jgi:hypothetical protein
LYIFYYWKLPAEEIPGLFSLPSYERRKDAASKVIEDMKGQLDNRVESYIKALPTCPMILGFHAVNTHADADKCCFCPCGRKLAQWRTENGLWWHSNCDSGKFMPNGLVIHLKTIGASNVDKEQIYHVTAYKYLAALYANFWGPDKAHKALCDVGSNEYNKAVSAEIKSACE